MDTAALTRRPFPVPRHKYEIPLDRLWAQHPHRYRNSIRLR
jgi:hypothetical protein